jgi:hypothetical protein
MQMEAPGAEAGVEEWQEGMESSGPLPLQKPANPLAPQSWHPIQDSTR